jgi:hypothetical protein
MSRVSIQKLTVSAQDRFAGLLVKWRFGRSRWRGGRLRVFVGRLFCAIKISSAPTTMDDNIRTVLNTWVQGKFAPWRGLGDEMAKRPLKTHTIYL